MKSIHAGLNAVAAVLVIISVVAVFDYHSAQSIPHMYSLHSWVGLTVVILYVLQVSVSVYLQTRYRK
jgi:cytochrome b561